MLTTLKRDPRRFGFRQERAPIFAFEAKPRGSEERPRFCQNAVGREKIGHLDRQKLIDYGKMRADQALVR